MDITTSWMPAWKRATDSIFLSRAAVASFALGGVMAMGAVPSAWSQTTAAPAASNVMEMAGSIATGPLLLGPGDLIDVQVFGTPELSGRLRMDQDGRITLPLGGTVELARLSPSEAAQVIEKQLRDGQIMLDPHVSVFIVQYATQGVTVIGEVRSPGTYPLFGPHTLYDALALAGGNGLSPGASVTITHRSDPSHPIVVPMNSPNYSSVLHSTVVLPGDTIVVSKAEMIYVVGDVGKPGSIPILYGQPINLLMVLANSGGFNKTAAVSKASIVRPTATGAETIPIDLNRVMKNQAPNLVLQAQDVLVIPRSGLKTFLEYAIPGATSAVSSAVATSFIVR